MINVAYITSRRNNRIHWFFDSLEKQVTVPSEVHVIVVDFFRNARDLPAHNFPNFTWVEPKPTVWQGTHRLTQENWFAASNSRNTALCHAADGHIAYVDDLSVLMPGWLDAVKRSMAENYIAIGCYQKVKNLQVENGHIKSFEAFGGGRDNRGGPGQGQYSCGGDLLYGCSVAMPVQALLDVNGWWEDCDGLSFEDVITGRVIGNTYKYSFRYDRSMATLESEEAHSEEPAMRREDWHWENGRAVIGGNGANDKSHAVLNAAAGMKRFEHFLGDGFPDIASLRQHVLGGGKFPVRSHPDSDWYAKIPLKDIPPK